MENQNPLFVNEYELTRDQLLRNLMHPTPFQKNIKKFTLWFTLFIIIVSLINLILEIAGRDPQGDIIYITMVAILMGVFVLFLPSMQYRKMKKDINKQINKIHHTEKVKITTKFFEDSIEKYDGLLNDKIKYNQLSEISQDDQYIYLHLNLRQFGDKYVCYILKGCFTTGSESDFIDFITEQIPKRRKSMFIDWKNYK